MNRAPIFYAAKAMRRKRFTQAEVAALDAAVDVAEGIVDGYNEKVLIDRLNAAFGTLEVAQVDGIQTLLAAMRAARWPLSWAAYGLATAWHETNQTLLPVKEAYWL